MVEFYNNPKAAVPDYTTIDPLMLHVAFIVDDIASVRQRLIAGGATPEGDPQTAPNGDVLAMLVPLSLRYGLVVSAEAVTRELGRSV